MTTLRALPVPDTEPAPVRLRRPPTSEEPRTQGALALSLDVDPERTDSEHSDPDFGPRCTAASGLPDARATAASMVQAVVEVLAGTRPPAQLTRWLAVDVLAAVHRRAALATRIRRGRAVPQRSAVVRAVRLCSPRDGVAEAAVVVTGDDRVRAVALRLEGLDGRWRVTALEIG